VCLKPPSGIIEEKGGKEPDHLPKKKKNERGERRKGAAASTTVPFFRTVRRKEEKFIAQYHLNQRRGGRRGREQGSAEAGVIVIFQSLPRTTKNDHYTLERNLLRPSGPRHQSRSEYKKKEICFPYYVEKEGKSLTSPHLIPVMGGKAFNLLSWGKKKDTGCLGSLKYQEEKGL